jgi:urease accessory protein
MTDIEANLADLLLDHEQRRRVRAKLHLVDGTPVTLALPRGTVLREGERLVTEAGNGATTVRAALEHVSAAVVDDPRHLARLAYQLGNRHAAVQFAGNTIYFLHNPALARLCEGLGAQVLECHRAFEPEALGTSTYEHAHEPTDEGQDSN